MEHLTALQRTLDVWSGHDRRRQEIAAAVAAVAAAGRRIADLIAEHAPIAGDGSADRLGDDAAGLIFEAFDRGAVGAAIFAGQAQPVVRWANAPLFATATPLQGLAGLAVNAPLATVFSLLPGSTTAGRPEAESFLEPGRRQLAAGYILYGPRTLLALTLGSGTDLYGLSRSAVATFRLIQGHIRIPAPPQPRRTVSGSAAPGGTTLASHCHRVLLQGGIYQTAADSDSKAAWPRTIFEANPLALLVEHAGGRALAAGEPLLDQVPTALFERTALSFGHPADLARCGSSGAGEPRSVGERSPLFERRGLYRA